MNMAHFTNFTRDHNEKDLPAARSIARGGKDVNS